MEQCSSEKTGIYNIFLETESYTIEYLEKKKRICINRNVVVLSNDEFENFIAKKQYNNRC